MVRATRAFFRNRKRMAREEFSEREAVAVGIEVTKSAGQTRSASERERKQGLVARGYNQRPVKNVWREKS